MVSFAELQSAAPSIAAFVQDKVAGTGLCLLGTLRRDGSPRVSPLELSIHGGGIYMGSMPGAVKARDLQRDGRCCILTPLADKDDLGGEAKLFCRAREVVGLGEHEEVRAAFKELTGFDMGELGAAHLFAFDIEGAAWQRVQGDDWRTTSWTPADGVRERVREGPTGETSDV